MKLISAYPDVNRSMRWSLSYRDNNNAQTAGGGGGYWKRCFLVHTFSHLLNFILLIIPPPLHPLSKGFKRLKWRQKQNKNKVCKD